MSAKEKVYHIFMFNMFNKSIIWYLPLDLTWWYTMQRTHSPLKQPYRWCGPIPAHTSSEYTETLLPDSEA